MSTSNLVSYYRDHNFNPVPINLDQSEAWNSHVEKRRNLYQRHLGIPVSLLNGCSVLEFGCNSGENALVLASFGANLTLVEPNEQVIPRLRELFNKFGLAERITAIVQEDMATFVPNTQYDLVIAEGFINTLDNREEMLLKLCRMLSPGGLVVISFDDCYGHLIELTRKLLFLRICQLEGIEDFHSEASLEMAKGLYLEDFQRLSASRPFEAWWADVLISPFVATRYLWSFPEILSVLDKTDCEFYSSSPSWTSMERFAWYKNVIDRKIRHQRLLEEWPKVFPFILSGLQPVDGRVETAPSHVVDAVFDLTIQISEYTQGSSIPISSVLYPTQLDGYLGRSLDPRLVSFNEDMKTIYEGIKANDSASVALAYYEAESLRELWGTPCQYVGICKSV